MNKHIYEYEDSHGIVKYDFEQMIVTGPDGESELVVIEDKLVNGQTTGLITVDYEMPCEYHNVQEMWEKYVNDTFEEVLAWAKLDKTN